MDSVLSFLLIFSVLMLVAGAIYFWVKAYENKQIINRRTDICDNLNLQDVHKEQFLELAQRTYVFYYSYVFQNTISIMCDLFGLVFSVVAFIASSENQSSTLLSLLAIIFVIVAIFIKPHRRSSQYLRSWRKMDYLTIDTLQKLAFAANSAKIDLKEITRILNDAAIARAKIENSISADED